MNKTKMEFSEENAANLSLSLWKKTQPAALSFSRLEFENEIERKKKEARRISDSLTHPLSTLSLSLSLSLSLEAHQVVLWLVAAHQRAAALRSDIENSR